MPYYQGDWYRNGYKGDFYRGDPGFFSFLGNVAKGFASSIPGIGPLLGAGIKGIESATSIEKAAPMAAGLSRTASLRAAIKGGVMKHPILSAAAGAGVVGAGTGIAGMKLKEHLMAKKKHRRMRVTNPRALRRAIRRTTGFAKLAMRTIHLVHPRKKARFGGFKRRVRR